MALAPCQKTVERDREGFVSTTVKQQPINNYRKIILGMKFANNTVISCNVLEKIQWISL